MTQFQKKVYTIVSRIPKGQTMTYKEVAIAVGEPKAYRAVGNVLNKNPFFGKIPCHRVIRSDGKPGGYVLGTNKKLKLLEKEKAL